MPVLYERVPHGKSWRYLEYVTPDPTVPKPQQVYVDEEIITFVVSIGGILLTQMEQLIPEHKRNRRMTEAVTNSILNMARGLGKPINEEEVEYWCLVWNTTMQQYQKGLLHG